jgi:ABC-type glycerol-3-phosphate transport system substrate-binding protein
VGRAFIRRAGVVTAAAALLTGALSACSSSGSKDGNVTIRYLTHWGPAQVKQLEAVASAFHKDNPKITVKFQAVPFANLLSTVQTQGSSPNGPTISSIYDLWLPALVKSGAADKAPASVVDSVKKAWPQNLVADVSKGGSVYGIPNEVDLYALNYNKKLFADAGIAAPPTTWDELKADAAKLTDKAKGQQGFGVITNWAAGVDHPFLSLAASNGGSFLTEDRSKSDLTSANVVATAQLYEDLVKSGATVPSMSAANANTTGPYLDSFANGKTGMLIMANWWESTLKQTMGDKFSDIATAPIPVGPSGSKASSISYSWLTMVNAHASSAAKDAAWKFLDYLNGPKSGKSGSSAMGDILLGQGILPSRTSDLAAHQSDLSDPFIKTYVDTIGDATPFPTTEGGAAASDALQTAIEDIVFGRASAQSAMGSADKAVNAALKSGQ